jgi:hypothetical protein
VVDVTGLPQADPSLVVQVLAYAFLDPLWKETMRHQRRYVWQTARSEPWRPGVRIELEALAVLSGEA